MSHQESYYRENEDYAQFLAEWDSSFYAKYADSLLPTTPGGKVLDVGCGVGQVMKRLLQSGAEVHGVDVSHPNIQRARKITPQAQVYDGQHLPYDSNEFDAAGALNVLEHVEHPESFIAELVRVVKPQGKIVLSSPNFFRVLGLRDYHPRMRGIKNKCRNACRLLQKRKTIRQHPELVRFDRMPPIYRPQFQPDDDAIVATNPMEMVFFLHRNHCSVIRVECTDRYVSPPVDFLLNLTPLRFLMFNAFVTARKLPLEAKS